ncbi:hypothetical protein RHGRI_001598 [Rhododendron griersonianum]|uniref:Transposase n=1 Tax=Rhododendron griersonianum TaxID=479676 RepID=A0AAV6LL90_9ERIC|nr:hypothetical protein RHGRI_001598 [Rhododendron griersonianum]
MDSSIFDFSLCGEPTDDVVDVQDVEDVELGGNSNPPVSTNADVIDVQDDTIVEVGQNTENRLKRKVPPRVPKPKKEPGKRYRSPFWDHFNEIKENQVTKWAECEEDLSLELEGGQGGSHRISVPRRPTVPNKLDWKKCELFVTFLKLFYDATKKFSASLFVTSNVFFHELYEVQVKIDELIANRDPYMSSMAIEMKRKFERLVKFCYTKSKGKAEGERMEKQVKDVLNRLYDSYAKEGELRQNVPSASSMPRGMEENEDCDHRMNLAMEFDTYLEEEYSSVCSSEVDKYLGDLCERRDIPDFDILVWWKTNSNKYPILSKLARDVLAVPVSTVASESAFSTGGRVLDPFRSSLSPSMVETLVCTQNWLLSTVPISLRQAMDKVEDFERELLQTDDANHASS